MVAAISYEDRKLAMEGFGEIEKRQGMNNIGRAWEVVREVWRRVDEMQDGDGEVDWREICTERGVSIVFWYAQTMVIMYIVALPCYRYGQ